MNGHLARIAEMERDERIRFGPTAIAEKKITREDAEREIGAWDTIALWLAGLPTPELGARYLWRDLEEVAGRAAAKWSAAAEEKPGDEDRAARAAWLALLAGRVAQQRATIDEMNKYLREQAQRRIA